MTTKPDSSSNAQTSPAARVWWRPRPPRLREAFTGPMTGARLNALVGLALWTLFGLALAAVVVSTFAACARVAVRDSWAWEVYKALAQLVVAALGVGFAYTFPTRLQAQSSYAAAREAALDLSESIRSFAAVRPQEGELDRLETIGSEVASRLVRLGATDSVVSAVRAAVADARGYAIAWHEGLAEDPTALLHESSSIQSDEVRQRIEQARTVVNLRAFLLAQVAATTPPP